MDLVWGQVAGAPNVMPQLPALFDSPTKVTLEDRNDKLSIAIYDVRKQPIDRFHESFIPLFVIQVAQESPART